MLPTSPYKLCLEVGGGRVGRIELKTSNSSTTVIKTLFWTFKRSCVCLCVAKCISICVYVYVCVFVSMPWFNIL